MAANASWSVQQAAHPAASGSPLKRGRLSGAPMGAAFGMTDAGGQEQHGQTQAAITEALRLALLAEGYDALAADTLAHRAGVGLAQVVRSAVGEAKDGPGKVSSFGSNKQSATPGPPRSQPGSRAARGRRLRLYHITLKLGVNGMVYGPRAQDARSFGAH